MGIGSAIGGGLGLFSGLMGQGAAKGGAGQMAQGNMIAALLQQQMFQQVQQNSQPYLGYGQAAVGQLENLMGLGQGGNPLTAPLTRAFAPTMEQLQQTPGYQFTLQQGLNATQNAYAAKGLGSSGNALRGAADYATGLASNTYQQQFQNDLASRQATYGMLTGGVNSGLQANGQVANAAGQFGQMIGNSYASAGNALGQGQIAGQNALNSGLYSGYGLSGIGSNPNFGGNFMSGLQALGGGIQGFFNGGGGGGNGGGGLF